MATLPRSLRLSYEEGKPSHRLDQFDKRAGEVEEEFGTFKDTQGRDELLYFGCVLENWQEDLVCLLRSLCSNRRLSVIIGEVGENTLFTSSFSGREAYSACGDKRPSFISA